MWKRRWICGKKFRAHSSCSSSLNRFLIWVPPQHPVPLEDSYRLFIKKRPPLSKLGPQRHYRTGQMPDAIRQLSWHYCTCCRQLHFFIFVYGLTDHGGVTRFIREYAIVCPSDSQWCVAAEKIMSIFVDFVPKKSTWVPYSLSGVSAIHLFTNSKDLPNSSTMAIDHG